MIILLGGCSSITGASVMDEHSDVNHVVYTDLVVEMEEEVDSCCFGFSGRR